MGHIGCMASFAIWHLATDGILLLVEVKARVLWIQMISSWCVRIWLLSLYIEWFSNVIDTVSYASLLVLGCDYTHLWFVEDQALFDFIEALELYVIVAWDFVEFLDTGI